MGRGDRQEAAATSVKHAALETKTVKHPTTGEVAPTSFFPFLSAHAAVARHAPFEDCCVITDDMHTHAMHRAPFPPLLFVPRRLSSKCSAASCVLPLTRPLPYPPFCRMFRCCTHRGSQIYCSSLTFHCLQVTYPLCTMSPHPPPQFFLS